MENLIKKRVLIVIGTRPEAVKMIPVLNELKKSDLIDCKLCITAQHRQMLDQVLQMFNIKPDYDLDIMRKKQDLYQINIEILNKIKKVYSEACPNLVLVHGDTATSFIAALAAYYMKIPVGHIEAGLRTNNLFSPWPEEGFRQLTARITKYHFAPTKTSKENLLSEGICDKKIFVTGNTVIDMLFYALEKIKNNVKLIEAFENDLKRNKIFLNDYTNHNPKKFVLITGHRRENFGKGFENICNAIKLLSDKYPLIDFIYPVHLNPKVKNIVHDKLGNNIENNNIKLISPIDYLPFIHLMNNSYIVLTDSGGVQEEAPSLGKPVLVMRNTSERPEAIKSGTAKLVGTNILSIVSEVSKLIENKKYYSKISQIQNPYGDGKAAKKILDIIEKNQH